MSWQKTKNNQYLELIKQKELIQHLEDLHRQNSEKINNLESSLDWITRQNEGYDVQITALKQHNECLREAANQWQIQYNDANILLLNTQEENISLKIELRNLQILHQEEVNKLKNDQSTFNNKCNDTKIKVSLDQCLKENKKITKENLKYLNQIKEIHQKYTESTKKYDDLHKTQIQLQNELKSTKSRVNELNNIVHESTLEIKRIQNENVDLKQTFGAKNSDNSNEQKSEPPACRYKSPDFEKKNGPSRICKSLNESPDVNMILYERPNVDDTNCKYTIPFDAYDDESCELKDHMDENIKKPNDLYQTTNEYLFQMDECIQYLGNVNKTQHAFMSDDLKNENDLNEEQKQLRNIEDIMKRLKYCVSETHKQQYNKNSKKEETSGSWFAFLGKWHL